MGKTYPKHRYQIDKERKILEHLRLDLTAVPHPVLTCLVCKESVSVPNSDNFIPYSIWVDTTDRQGRVSGRTKQLPTNKAVVKWFQEKHFESCINKG